MHNPLTSHSALNEISITHALVLNRRFIGAARSSATHPGPTVSQIPYLGEPDISRLLSEALTADVEAVFADETGLVCADAAAYQSQP